MYACDLILTSSVLKCSNSEQSEQAMQCTNLVNGPCWATGLISHSLLTSTMCGCRGHMPPPPFHRPTKVIKRKKRRNNSQITNKSVQFHSDRCSQPPPPLVPAVSAVHHSVHFLKSCIFPCKRVLCSLTSWIPLPHL